MNENDVNSGPWYLLGWEVNSFFVYCIYSQLSITKRKTVEKGDINNLNERNTNINMDDRNVKDKDKIELNISTDDNKRNKRKAAVLGKIRCHYLFNE